MNCFDEKGNTINNLTQWEQGRELTVKDLSPDKTYMAHVFNNYSTKAKVVPATNVGGNVTFPVPNILLQKPYTLLAVVYEKQGTKRLSVGKIILNVESTAMPEDYEFVENIEYTDWVELTAEARTLLDQLQTDAQAIERIITPVKANNLGALVVENNVKGNPILLKDSADAKAVELEITGSTTQNGVPSLDNTVPIVNGTFDKIWYNGKNLYSKDVKTTMLTNPDGVIGEYRESPTIIVKVDKPTDLVISGDFNMLGSEVIRAGLFNEFPKIGTKGLRLTLNSSQNTFNTTTYKYVLMTFLYSDNENRDKAKFQVEFGTKPTSHEPYKGLYNLITQIGLSEWDVVKKIDNVWKKESYFASKIINKADGMTDMRPYVYLDNPMEVVKSATEYIGFTYCTALPYNVEVGNPQKTDSGYFIYKDSRMIFRDSKFKTIGEWNNYLSQHPMTVVYKTKTPTYEVLPKETQNVLNKIQTFYPDSTIQTNDGIELNLKYVADTKKYIDNKFSELQTAIVAVGGNV